MLTVELLPAGNGDCLWIEYGSGRKVHRILVDGGTRPTRAILKQRIQCMNDDDRHFNLVVLTHVDLDHIGGLLPIWQDDSLTLDVDDFWMNGWQHLDDHDTDDTLSALQGEQLARFITSRDVPWNRHFSKRAVVVPDEGPLPVAHFPGGAQITLLSPNRPQLVEMIPAWDEAIDQLAFDESTTNVDDELPDMLGDEYPNVEELSAAIFMEDDAIPNGTSIAFLLEIDHISVLFAADSHPSLLERSVRRLLDQRQKAQLTLSALKVSHHGSRKNTSSELLSLLDCDTYLFSTNGAKHSHPHAETIARILAHQPLRHKHLAFNYASKFTRIWDDEQLRDAHNFDVSFPNKLPKNRRK